MSAEVGFIRVYEEGIRCGDLFDFSVHPIIDVLFKITGISKFVTKPRIFLQQEIMIKISSKN